MKNIVLILSVIIVFGCTTATKKEDVMGNFAHTVYFWLKNPDNAADRMAFEKSLKKFINNSVHIKTKHIGTPAATNREVIDNSYTYSLLLTFETKAAHDAYQDEPNHKLFIEESLALWDKVIVYDSEELLE